MGLIKWLLSAVIFIVIVNAAFAVKCYECNVWKAGYGHLCDNPRIREDCIVCMKTETTIYMGYYKNVPRTSVIVSKVCGKSRTINWSHGCQYIDLPDGQTKRCYCDDDMCNSAPAVMYSSGGVSWRTYTLVLLAVLWQHLWHWPFITARCVC